MRARLRCVLFSLIVVALPAAAMAQGGTAAPPVAVPFSHQDHSTSAITGEQDPTPGDGPAWRQGCTPGDVRPRW